MRFWIVCATTLIMNVSGHALEENFRSFKAVDPVQLEKKSVPRGYGKIFVDAGRQNNIDPLILAAISAHESGAWKSKAARTKNNWMGLVARGSSKRFSTPEESIFYAAALLNRRPFKGHDSLKSIASIYCASEPSNWRRSVLQWRRQLAPK